MPWALPVGLAYICAAIAYLNGNGWPKSTSAARKYFFRARPLVLAEFNWAFLAGLAGVTSLWLFYAACGFLSTPPLRASQVELSFGVFLGAAIIAAAVTAIAEEGGLRGFMQAPLERLIGPAPAIALTSFFFVLLHLSHGFAALARNAPFYFAAGCIYGLLAYLTQSILPSLILHFLGDILVFSLGSSHVHLPNLRGPSTTAFLIASAVMFACGSGAAFFKLARLSSVKRSNMTAEITGSDATGNTTIA
jgi:membrane protease YdiL (CAAX protease family)